MRAQRTPTLSWQDFLVLRLGAGALQLASYLCPTTLLLCKATQLTLVPLNRMCSRKCATPLLASFSNLLPELIHMPTVVVSAKGIVSEATRRPLGSVVTCSMYTAWGSQVGVHMPCLWGSAAGCETHLGAG